MLLQPRWAPNCRPMFVPVVALLGVFGLWIARLHMGNLARILVAMLVSMHGDHGQLVMFTQFGDIVRYCPPLVIDTAYIGVNREMTTITR